MNDININDISMYGEHGVEMIDDNIISRNTTFSSEKMAESYAGASNQNILHNWDMTNPVNQRGLRTYTSTGHEYFIDRWLTANRTTAEIVNGGILLIRPDSAPGIIQRIEFPKLYLNNEPYTLSIMLGDGKVISATGILPTSPPINTPIFSTMPTDDLGMSSIILLTNGNLQVHINGINGKPLLLKAVKLELGTVSTLANDPPMDFGRELAICQRYQVRLTEGTTTRHVRCDFLTVHELRFFIPLPVQMRAIPTIMSLNSHQFTIHDFPSGVIQTGFTLLLSAHATGMRVRKLKQNHGLTDAHLNIIGTIFDANL